MESESFMSMSEAEIAANNQATFKTLVDVKLQEIENFMDLPEGMYPYPFAGMTHQTRKQELATHLLPMLEAMGIETFMNTPTIVTVICVVAAEQRNEADDLPEMLKVLNTAFMTVYGLQETSNEAASAFNQLMTAFTALSYNSEANAQQKGRSSTGFDSAQKNTSVH